MMSQALRPALWEGALVEARAQLPPVDPDFRLDEHRPEALHAYARGLLQQLRHIRAGGKAKGYPIATIKAATVWLIDSYAEVGIAPAPEAAQLVREIVRPNRDASTLPVRRSSEAAYLAAIEFEARHRPDPTGCPMDLPAGVSTSTYTCAGIPIALQAIRTRTALCL